MFKKTSDLIPKIYIFFIFVNIRMQCYSSVLSADIVRSFLPVYVINSILKPYLSDQPTRETLRRSLLVSKIERGKKESHFSRRKLDTPRSPFLLTYDDMPRQRGSSTLLWLFVSSSARSDIYFHRRSCQRYLDIHMDALVLQDTWNSSSTDQT